MIEHLSTLENLHSPLMIMREWAYRCHLEKLETSLGNESYARIEIVAWIRELLGMGLRCHPERPMLGSEPYVRLCRRFWREMGLGCHPEGVVR